MSKRVQTCMIAAVMICTICTAFSPNAKAASEYDGLIPKKSGYSASLSSDMDIPTAAFGARLDPATASAGEMFTLYGAAPSAKFPQGLGNYWMMVLAYTQRCYDKLGYIPDTLTPEVLAKTYGGEVSALGAAAHDGLKSPISGEFPVLNATSFVRGGFQIRLLTDDEKHRLALKIPAFHQAWYEGTHQYPGGDGTKVPVKCGPVFYVCVYGETGPILQQVMFNMDKVTPDSSAPASATH